MKTKILEVSRVNFYLAFVWGPLTIVGVTVLQWWHREAETVPFVFSFATAISTLAVFMGLIFIALGVYIRKLAAANDELTNEMLIQKERIWRLEVAIAELKGTRPRQD